MADDWFAQLMRARAQLGISQVELAARSHVSLPSIKSYESGKRHPSRPYLTAILDALKIERTERSAILEAAGYASDWQLLTPSSNDLAFDLGAGQAEVDRVVWPAFLMNEMSEVISANRAVQRLWDVDLRAEYTEIADRNMLAVASNPRFADRCVNWDDAVGTLVGVFKGHHRGPEDLESPSPYFRSVLNRFLADDPRYIARFLRLWQDVAPRVPELRWHYPVVWDEPGVGQMRFDCVVSNANERDGWSFNDWLPIDSATWQGLEALRDVRP